MALEAPQNLTVDGVDYPVSSFSENVQRLVVIHTTWRSELAEERHAVAKTEAAIRGLDAELAQMVGAELAAKKAATEATAANDAAGAAQ